MLDKGQRRRTPDHRPLLQFLQGQSERTAEDVVLEHVKVGYDYVERPPDYEGGVEQDVRAQSSQAELDPPPMS